MRFVLHCILSCLYSGGYHVTNIVRAWLRLVLEIDHKKLSMTLP